MLCDGNLQQLMEREHRQPLQPGQEEVGEEKITSKYVYWFKMVWLFTAIYHTKLTKLTKKLLNYNKIEHFVKLVRNLGRLLELYICQEAMDAGVQLLCWLKWATG